MMGLLLGKYYIIFVLGFFTTEAQRKEVKYILIIKQRQIFSAFAYSRDRINWVSTKFRFLRCFTIYVYLT